MSKRRQNLVLGAEEFFDGFGLCGGFDNKKGAHTLRIMQEHVGMCQIIGRKLDVARRGLARLRRGGWMLD